jgi:hypothetical protein
MIKLDLKINQVSFSDCKISDMKLDIENKTFKINVEELYIIDKKDYVESIRFVGSNWDNLYISSYNSQNKQTVEIKQIEKMEEIAEIRVNGNQIIFCGFGAQSGNWIELTFNNLTYAFIKI